MRFLYFVLGMTKKTTTIIIQHVFFYLRFCVAADLFFFLMAVLYYLFLFYLRSCTELSPSPVLSCCSPLALQYPPLARHLFNAAFVAVWAELAEGQQKHLTDALETALRASTCPTTVLEALLNLAEYMEQTEHPLVRVICCLC